MHRAGEVLVATLVQLELMEEFETQDRVLPVSYLGSYVARLDEVA
jgi:hypothetical protein